MYTVDSYFQRLRSQFRNFAFLLLKCEIMKYSSQLSQNYCWILEFAEIVEGYRLILGEYKFAGLIENLQFTAYYDQ